MVAFMLFLVLVLNRKIDWGKQIVTGRINAYGLHENLEGLVVGEGGYAEDRG